MNWKDVLKEVAQPLVQAGFKRSGSTFLRGQAEGVITQLTLEKYRWNNPYDQRFQLVLGAYLPDGSGQPFSLKTWNTHHSQIFQKPAEYLWGAPGFSFVVPQEPTD